MTDGLPPVSDLPPANDGSRSADNWLTLSLPLPARGKALLLVDALRRLGAKAVEQHQGRALAHFLPPVDPQDFLAEVHSTLRASTNLNLSDMAWEWKNADRLWESLWTAETRARPITSYFSVLPLDSDQGPHPSGVGGRGSLPAADGDSTRADKPPWTILLRPGLAFGAGDHPTTQSCLEFLERQPIGTPPLLDVGTGSGILAIAGAFLGATRVIGFDADLHAAKVAAENVKLNGVSDQVQISHRRIEPGARATEVPAAGIMANLEPETLIHLLASLHASLHPDGWMIVSGVPIKEQTDVLTSARGHGFHLEAEEIRDGWWTAVLRKHLIPG